MDEEDEPKITQNINCNVCGLNTFVPREGYYYCKECGTKQEQVRDVAVVHPEVAGGVKTTKRKIQTTKAEKPQLTSWECYNYIIHGIVEDLLNIGAKPELKLMTLQVWSAYLRYMEVAFFSKNDAELPKLGVRFLESDSRVLYNHNPKKVKRRVRESVTSGERDWRRQKRKLDESAYSIHSSQNTETTGTSYTSVATTHAVQLNFSAAARKYYKRVMPISHLKKHAMDVEAKLKCHKMHAPYRALKKVETAAYTMNMKQVITILAISLNLIQDDIQISDLLRFIAEGHLSKKKALLYFPENISPHVKPLLKEIGLFAQLERCPDKTIRDQATLLAKLLNIKHFKRANLKKLALRYVTELGLPEDIGIFIERLMNLLPPKMKTRAPHVYPAYEARAMAYIIFVLKLLVGLDDHKENCISESAKTINSKLETLNEDLELDDKYPLLFVWSEWVEYIEMRKTIVSQYNFNFCRHYKQLQSMTQLLEEIDGSEDQNEIPLGKTEAKNTRGTTLQNVLNKFLKQNELENESSVDKMLFAPSYTPAHSYFNQILYRNTSEKIPKFMYTIHKQRCVEPFVQEKSLRKYLRSHNYQLKTRAISSTECNKCDFVGTFRNPNPHECYPPRVGMADFNISEANWLKEVDKIKLYDELEFKPQLDSYHSIPKTKKNQNVIPVRHDFTIKQETTAGDENEHLNVTLHSIDIFSEFDMQPVELGQFLKPQRKIHEEVNVLDDSSEDDDDNDNTLPNTLELITSSMDYWLLSGTIITLKERHKKALANKFPRSFFWLLETCAQSIGVDWIIVYEQLLVIEIMFAYGIENLDDLKDCVHLRYDNPIKDFNKLLNKFREIW